jgi:hypothetical protein
MFGGLAFLINGNMAASAVVRAGCCCGRRRRPSSWCGRRAPVRDARAGWRHLTIRRLNDADLTRWVTLGTYAPASHPSNPDPTRGGPNRRGCSAPPSPALGVGGPLSASAVRCRRPAVRPALGGPSRPRADVPLLAARGLRQLERYGAGFAGGDSGLVSCVAGAGAFGDRGPGGECLLLVGR